MEYKNTNEPDGEIGNDFSTLKSESAERSQKILIQDIASFAGTSLKALAVQSAEIIIDSVKKNTDLEQSYRADFGLSADENFEDGIKRKAVEKAENFEGAFHKKAKEFHDQADFCAKFAKKEGYISEIPVMHIVVTDWFLSGGKVDLTGTDSYDYRTGITYICIDRPNILLAHEAGHALSHTKQENGIDVVGFTYYEPGGKQRLGAQWMNEGMTVIWENRTVNDGSTFYQRDWEQDFYPHCRDLVTLVLHKCCVPLEIAFKAYFGDKDAMKYVNNAIQSTFHCELEDLDCLTSNLDIQWATSIINGEPMEIPFDLLEDRSKIQSKRLLARIFPNVRLLGDD